MRRLVWLVLPLLAGCPAYIGSLETEFRGAHDWLRAERYDLAFSQADEGLRYAQRRGDRRFEWRFRILKAEILVARGEVSQAVSALGGDPPGGPQWAELRCRALLVRGQAAYQLAHFSESEDLIARATDEARQAGSASLTSEVDLRRGSLLVRLSRFGEAEAAFRRVIEDAAGIHDTYLEASATGNLGYALLHEARYDAAIPWFERARALFTRLGAASSVARATGNIGWCRYRLGDFNAARLEMEQAEAESARVGNRLEQQIWAGDAGGAFLDAEEYASAEAAFQRALAISRKLPNDLWTAQWLSSLAAADLERGDWDRAEAYNNEALALKRRLPGTRSEAYSLYNAARIAMVRKQFRAAEGLFLEALHEPADDPRITLVARAGLAALYVQTGRPRQADAGFRAALEEINRRSSGLLKDEYKFSYLASLMRFYRDYVDFLMSGRQPESALEIADSARSRVLAERTGRAEAVTRHTAADYRRLARQANAVLLEYWLGERESYLWAVTPQQIRCYRLPSKNAIRSLAQSYSASILAGRNPLEAGGGAGQRLYQALLAPLAVGAPPEGRFIIVPDEDLYALNFESLPSGGEDGKFWIERATVALAPSLDYLIDNGQARRPRAKANVLLIGDPTPVLSQFPRLEYASKEMDSIASAMGSDRARWLQGAAARPEAYSAAQPERFGFIHFAAHAAANQQSPLDSAVILSGPPENCKLFARDVMAVPLAAEMVTISACRSAGARTYAGEGLVGFAWAFLKAGSRNVVAGLWDVNDRSTAQLMTGLYTRVAAGASPEDALRASKLALIRGGGSWAKPFYWAPFQVYTGTY